MKTKENWMNFGAALIPYLFLVVSAWGNWKLIPYMPWFFAIGALGTYLLAGLFQQKGNKWVARLTIVAPYIIGAVCYTLARTQKSHQLVTVFRKMMPHIYAIMDNVSFAIKQVISRDAVVILLLVGVGIISLLLLELGAFLRRSEKGVAKFCFNGILAWITYFYMFLIVHEVMINNALYVSKKDNAMVVAGMATLVVFVGLFFVGRYSRTCSNKVLQLLSSSSITIFGLAMYVGGLVLAAVGNTMVLAIFERYLLPVATSFIGTLCKAMGLAVGAKAEVISQYGMAATIIMLLIPTLLIYAGKWASMPDEKKERDEANEIKEAKIINLEE